ncbi:MAG: polysaccharide deacetylase family protein [Burkholderiaceae bacterium]
MSDAETSALPANDADASEGAAFDALHEELGHWQQVGRHCPLWWRDDDLIADSPALRTMADMAERNGVPVLVAVIPAQATATLAQETAAMALLSFCQHGYDHRNHEPAGAPPSEFGAARPLDALTADLQAGRDGMAALFGDRFMPVFVPPWNRLRLDAMPVLKGLGLRGVSQYPGEAAAAPAVLPVVNAHVDILQWSPRPPIACHPTAVLVQRLVAHLRDSRAQAEPAAPVGVLTHHRPMLDDAWTFMQRLIDVSRSYNCVRWMSPAELFPA